MTKGFYCIVGLAVVIGSLLQSCANKSDFHDMLDVYMQTVSAFNNGTIEIPPDGVVNLPKNLEGASVDGCVYASKPSFDGLLVAFKIWRGKGFNMIGYLYSAKDFDKQKFNKDYYGNNIVEVGPVELVLEERIDSHWYKVSYQLD